MTIRTISLPGGPTISLEDAERDGTALVFSHGYMMNRNMFAPQVEHFAKSWRCIAWDARGHGDTEWSGDFDYWDSARDLLGVMDALGLDKVVHVGMSQGGLVGMRAALLAPERFHGIVQLSTQAGELPPSDDDSFAKLIGDWIENGPDRKKVEFLADYIIGPDADKSYWHAAWMDLPREKVRDATHALTTIDPLWHRLKEVSVPVATIHGLSDIATSHELGLKTPQGVPDPRGVSLIPGGPHAVNLTHPARVNKAIEDFLEELVTENPDMKA